MRKAKGLPLFELLVVVSIIGIIAALAIPRLLESQKAAKEASAIASLRTITTAQFAYWSNGRTAFAATLRDLEAEGHINPGLGSGEKDGYSFDLEGGRSTFSARANPISVLAGSRHFFTDESGIIRVDEGCEAGPGSPVLSSDR